MKDTIDPPRPRRLGGPRARILKLGAGAPVAVEVGVHEGDFSRAMLDVMRPGRLHLVDPWQSFDDPGYDASWYGRATAQVEMDLRHEAVCDRFAAERAAGRVVVHRMTGVEAAAGFADASLDFVYLDGDHSHAGVSADIAAFWPKLKPGAILAGDDYKLGRWWGDGVVRAFHERLCQGGAIIEMKLGGQIALRKLDTPG